MLDAAVAEQVLKALQPAELEIALVALRELQSGDQAIMRQWQIRLERAEYENRTRRAALSRSASLPRVPAHIFLCPLAYYVEWHSTPSLDAAVVRG